MAKFAIFDLDDTLVDSTRAIDRWFVELAEQRGLGAEGLAFLRSEQERPVPPEESFRAIVERFGFTESAQELRHRFWERLPLLARPYEGVAAGLAALHATGWRIALLTNGKALDQRPKLRDGLLGLFDVLCYAEDEQILKPDPAVFRLVADRVGADLRGAWMIGDSLQSDIAGGAGTGMSTIWISNGRPLPAGGPSPDVIVTAVAEVFPVLRRYPSALHQPARSGAAGWASSTTSPRKPIGSGPAAMVSTSRPRTE
jgi:putative hydrolase of the HAD superfamily